MYYCEMLIECNENMQLFGFYYSFIDFIIFGNIFYVKWFRFVHTPYPSGAAQNGGKCNFTL